MKKIGIMGGTFDPIHKGHLMLAQAAYSELGLDEVLFLPSKNPPHKLDKQITSEEARCRMVMLAIEGYPQFRFSDIEMKRQGRSYTVDTLRQLKSRYEQDMLYFIMGADSLLMLQDWKDPEEILSLAVIVVAVRDDVGKKELEEVRKGLLQKYSGEILLLSMERSRESSTMIREAVHEGKDISQMVPEPVVAYIEEKGLYQ